MRRSLLERMDVGVRAGMALLVFALYPAVAGASSRSWSGPIHLDGEAYPQSLNVAACPSVNQCTAVGSAGAATFNLARPLVVTQTVGVKHELRSRRALTFTAR